MLLKSLLALLLIVSIVIVITLFYLGQSSKSGSAVGLVDGKLAQCPTTPNCVCSEYPQDTSHYIDAIDFNGDPGQAMRQLTLSVISAGGKVTSQTDQYLAAIFTSKLFGFVDDVEFRIDVENRRIHVRSASRVGHNDLDANRKRLTALLSEFNRIKP